MEIYNEIIAKLHQLASFERAKTSKKFFKIGITEYGFDDIFIGVSVPMIRVIAKEYIGINYENIKKILSSKIHEERQLALMILVEKFMKFKEERWQITEFYLHNDNIKYVNSWDLVDLTAYKIVGEFLMENPAKITILHDLANSDNFWARRIAIVSTLAFIKQNKFDETILIVERFLSNPLHDLLQKASGWMLREVGKKNRQTLMKFLELHHKKMPRVMLRYATEKFTKEERLLIVHV